MRFLVVDTDYPEFLQWFYGQHPGLSSRSYEEQLHERVESLFGIAGFYSNNLSKLGHEAWDVYANNEFLQLAWAQKHTLRIRPEARLRGWLARERLWANRIARSAPSVLTRRLELGRARTWADRIVRERRSKRVLEDILAAQVRESAPDVLLNQAMDGISPRLLRKLRPHVSLLVGQIAAPLPRSADLHCYDLILSSLPNLVHHFRMHGIPSELIRLAFEPMILTRLGGGAPRIPVSFVGSLSRNHPKRIRWLEQLCERIDVQVWGPGIDGLPTSSPIRSHYQGVAWGLDMYRILRTSKVTLNRHIDMAGSYANNLRLFEATGVGALLVTDWKENLPELFEPNQEVVAYRDPEECASLIQHYLENDNEREAIARAGQQRTMREHTYETRTRELVEIVERFL